jgi:UDP-N-acetylmuramoyl-tripeptide--D-alanyl-D-alanine ligase
VITFGSSPGVTLQATDIQSAWPERLSFTLHADGRSLPVRTTLCGKHWVTGALAALGVATAMGVPLESAVSGLALAEPATSRMRPVARNGVTFIQDDLKAPVWALDTAFGFLADAQATRKIAVIGTLSDYSTSAKTTYPQAAKRALAVADQVVFVGPNARHALKAKVDADAGSLCAFPTLEEAADHLRDHLVEGDLVLVKGSREADHLGRLPHMW